MADDVFSKFARTATPTQPELRAGQPRAVQPLHAQANPVPNPESDKMPYSAVGLNRQAESERRLLLYFQDNTLALMSYAYLMEVVCTSHQFLSLVFTQCVITLKGYNLDGLMELLQDEKVRALQCYHPK